MAIGVPQCLPVLAASMDSDDLEPTAAQLHHDSSEDITRGSCSRPPTRRSIPSLSSSPSPSAPASFATSATSYISSLRCGLDRRRPTSLWAAIWIAAETSIRCARTATAHGEQLFLCVAKAAFFATLLTAYALRRAAANKAETTGVTEAQRKSFLGHATTSRVFAACEARPLEVDLQALSGDSKDSSSRSGCWDRTSLLTSARTLSWPACGRMPMLSEARSGARSEPWGAYSRRRFDSLPSVRQSLSKACNALPQLVRGGLCGPAALSARGLSRLGLAFDGCDDGLFDGDAGGTRGETGRRRTLLTLSLV